MKLAISTLIFLAITQRISGFVAYDCKTTIGNLTKISLLDVGQCTETQVKPTVEKIAIQLVQKIDYGSLPVYQCKVDVTRVINHCGMHSHLSAVEGGVASYIYTLSREQCLGAINDGSLLLFGHARITGLASNHTSTHTLTIAGKTSTSGNCAGGTYADRYGSWSDVVVIGSVTITLTNYQANVQYEDGVVILASGTRCKATEQKCIDEHGGQTFWTNAPSRMCGYHEYETLYEGVAEKMTDMNQITKQSLTTVYSLVSQDITFALGVKTHSMVCGHKLLHTEHPRLFIVETRETGPLNLQKGRNSRNLDLMTYVNSKFVYTERHIRTQLQDMYRRIQHNKCILERKVLYNSLNLAVIAPDQFASNIMQKPGYLAYLAGEVIYVMQCQMVEVRVRQPEKCYSDIPITYKNESMFVTRQSHILKTIGTEIPCSKIMPVTYKVDGRWIQSTPDISVVLDPSVLKPNMESSWTYENPGDLARSGIYPETDLDTLRKLMMFPLESPSITNILNRNLNNQILDHQGLDLSALLDKDAIEEMAENAWNKVWNRFMSFGTVSAGLFGIFVAARVVKLVIDTVIHGVALHGIYGWSLMLVCAIWDSLTTFLIHLNVKRFTKKKPNAPQNEEEKELEVLVAQDRAGAVYQPTTAAVHQGSSPPMYPRIT